MLGTFIRPVGRRGLPTFDYPRLISGWRGLHPLEANHSSGILVAIPASQTESLVRQISQARDCATQGWRLRPSAASASPPPRVEPINDVGLSRGDIF
jgi:hypothetical protein